MKDFPITSKKYKDQLPTFKTPDLYLDQSQIVELPKHGGLFRKIQYKGATLLGRFEIRAVSLLEHHGIEWEGFDRSQRVKWTEDGRRRAYGPDLVIRIDSSHDWTPVEVKGIWDQRASDRKRIYEESKDTQILALVKEVADELELAKTKQEAWSVVQMRVGQVPNVRRNVFEQKADRIERENSGRA